jgi:hypothetical protein
MAASIPSGQWPDAPLDPFEAGLAGGGATLFEMVGILAGATPAGGCHDAAPWTLATWPARLSRRFSTCLSLVVISA